VADRLAVTGVLLVGGASERFGSPKALARFRGESLAERGWRLLREVCEEVLAVGKAADGLGLPFAVLDDGAGERAPVFGLLAGLRAASHELCLALPVDTPLVTAELLRLLARERAVPQTGPLPGAYERAALPGLERRVAAGELSLWGVNPRTLEVDERLLANVNTRAQLLEAQLADWASEREDVRAAVVIGPQARTAGPGDRDSDLDVLLVVADPGRYAGDATWSEEFGTPVATFHDSSKSGHVERRVRYATGEDAHFVLVPEGAEDDELAQVALRGYRVLLDRIGLAGSSSRKSASTAT
jgi:molybdopterin-guanine dinucleotide biosynthesis protein A